MQQLKDLIQQLGGDPYQILNTDPNSDVGVLRKNYRTLAIKYHPDKNNQESAKLMFLKVNQAYEYLEQQENRRTYQSYIKAIEEQKKRTEGMDQKRRKFAQDLKRREEQHLKTQADIQKELKKRKQFFQKKMEEAEQRQNIKTEIFDSIGVQQYYQLISSFQINWRQGLSFTEKMLAICFQKYGKIEKIKIESKRNRACITLNSIEDCTKVVKQFKHPLMTINYQLQSSKRDHLLKALNKQKIQKLDLSLSSQNIQRFKEIVNRGSGMYKSSY